MICVLLWVLCLAWWGINPAEAQSRKQPLDFLNERLKIPESIRFVEPEYVESGVGVPFGVDKRLSYYTGNYAEAIARFSEGLRRYSYKAEMWVYLARAYFYEKKPEDARDTIRQAAQIMPDLSVAFWDPLLESMLSEIRKRALDQQAQIDFYTRSQEDYLELFRLFRFLGDEKGMVGIVQRAESRAEKMSVLATMVAVNTRAAYLGEADRWLGLADQLRAELRAVGFIPPAPKQIPNYVRQSVASTDVDLLEETHQLQLKVDFYGAVLADFSALFDNYLALNLPSGAQFVLEGLQREATRLRLKADTSNDFAEVSQLQEEADAFDELQRSLRERLGESGL
jgi:tetratricopeptide (TPR) repeat protein